MEQNTRKVNKCLRCGWIWVQRTQRSYRCPKCHSFEWDKDENSRNKFLSEIEHEKTQPKNEDSLKEIKIQLKDKKLTEKEVKELIKSLMEMI